MERLRNFTIIGNAEELVNIMLSGGIARVSYDEIMSILDKDCPNYVVVDEKIEGKKCRMAFFWIPNGYEFKELCKLIETFDADVIFGYGWAEGRNEVKVVSVWN